MNKMAWVKLLAQNRKPIFKLIAGGTEISGYEAKKRSRRCPRRRNHNRASLAALEHSSSRNIKSQKQVGIRKVRS